ncbi:hypothetical protein EV356DRAFT_500153 [Viridothelium virens]|uniref:Uncharacterized protein n=1 Tax=Viridothelium virens TaxID=1048519 RepID=A0A6A6HCN3_VIRVR|nr:hypothetical protein EV356DRAFT_500153 [Viridothelium virens]
MIAESEVASTAIDIAWLTGNTQGVTTRPWEKYLNPSLRSAAEAQATSIYRAEQSIVRADLQAGTNVLLIPSVKERLLGAVAGTLAMMALWM